MTIQDAFLNRRLAEIVADDHAKKLFCPTAICLVRRQGPFPNEPEFLMVHDRYGYDYCVQGRIGEGEQVTAAVRRKVWEEAGIFNVTKIRFLLNQKVPYLPGRSKRDGFEKGKDYLLFSAELDGAQLRSFSSTTITNCYWVGLPELFSLCQSLEGPKADLLYGGLEILGHRFIDPDSSSRFM